MSSDVIQLELERAQALVDLGRFDQARGLLQQLLGSEPDIASGWCLLSQAQLGLDDPEEALAAANRAAALAPDDDWPHRLRSIALMDLKDTDGAIEAARAAVVANPENWQTHLRLSVSLSRAKRDKAEALAAARHAVELAPSQPDAHFALGLANEFQGNPADADRSYRQALALDPQHGPAHNALARRQLATSSFGRVDNLAAAASGFRGVVQTDPRADYAVKNLELVLRVFIARLSYLIFLIVYVASRADGSSLRDRLLPLLLIAIPAAFAVRFLARLAPDIRRHVWSVAFHGWLAVPSILQSCAIGLLVVSAAAPGGARAGIGVAALLTSLAARVVLYIDKRRRQRAAR